MIRLRLFGRCRIYHDPVSPVLKKSAEIGWTSWFRDIDLVTPRRFKGEELLMRTKGWWTVDPDGIAEIINKYGTIILGDEGELMVELKDEAIAKELTNELFLYYGEEILIAP